MSKTNEGSVLTQLFKTFFGKHWPVWVGGILLGFLNILLFAIKSPWGASGGIGNWGENIYSVLGVFSLENVTATNASLYGMLCLMIIVGSFIGALFSKDFALRIPPKGEMIKGLLGGILMAIGATIGLGCTIGAFFSGVPALSGGAIIFSFALMVGVIVALRYLMWEMEKFPKWSSGKSYTWFSAKGKGRTHTILGWVMVVGVGVLAYSYTKSLQTMTWFVIVGALFGLISQRSRFCIVKAFRDPLMTGESHGAVGVIAGLMIALFGFTAIKYFGIGVDVTSLRAREMTWVFPHFWAKAAIGGVIFGIGMTIAGGCAVGTLWRIGEGQFKLWLSGIGFLLMAPISKLFLVPKVDGILPQSMKFKSFLPDYIGYGGSFALVVAILLFWYWFVKWNEKTGKFSAF
ncbi:MAG: YeeE/YedE family protein [Bacteroidales bacterium]|nr:YeeE/YedE family protein [Bacteroidales bacterium]